MKNLFPAVLCVLILASCNSQSNLNQPGAGASVTKSTARVDSGSQTPAPAPSAAQIANAAAIMNRRQVPVLCYHHIKDAQPGQKLNDYTVSFSNFRDQMKALHDSGYHTVLPDQLYAYLTTGAPLPANPVMITFDDTDEEQFTVGKTEMDKYG